MEQADANALKKEICTSVYDSKYGKIRWLDLYFRDGDYFLIKAKKEGVSSNTIGFFEGNMQALAYIRDTISIDFFREQQCMELVDRFCSPQKSQAGNRIEATKIKLRSQQEKRGDAQNKEDLNQKTPEGKKTDVLRKTNENVLTVPEKRKVGASADEQKQDRANSIPVMSEKLQKDEQQKEKVDRSNYCSNLIKILVLKTRKRELLWNNKSSQTEWGYRIEYATKNLWNREKIREVILVIDHLNGQQTGYLMLNRERKILITPRACAYLEKAIKSTKMQVTPLKISPQEDQEHARKIEEFRQELEKKRLEREREKKEQEARERQKKLEKRLRRQKRRAEKRKMAEMQQSTEMVAKKVIEQKQQVRKVDALPKKVEAPTPAKLPQQISARDFVVRRSVFKCTHDKHKIENLDAAVEIIDKAGNVCSVTINAGYCPTCKVFFIMESSYEKLKKKGIPICRVSDEKTYLKSSFANGMRLAQESILMQYGYNVNQAEGLTGTRRKRILAVLIDKKIMSRSEIISYLDFFICQRQSNPRFEIAISKWEDDRDFVESYRVGEFHQYGVNAIHRR